LLRNRIPECVDADEDWFCSDIESLSDAVTKACSVPLENEPRAVRPQWPSAPTETETKQDERPATQASVAAAGKTMPTPPPKGQTQSGAIAANLLDRLTGTVAVCRPLRRPLSLLLVKLGAGEELAKSCGPQEIATIRQVLGSACAKLDHPGTVCLPHKEFGFALILPGADRQQAVELGNNLLRAIRSRTLPTGTLQKDSLTLDMGVATVAQPPKNFPPRDLLDGAERCLYASHASGGSVVKSIEIY